MLAVLELHDQWGQQTASRKIRGVHCWMVAGAQDRQGTQRSGCFTRGEWEPTESVISPPDLREGREAGGFLGNSHSQDKVGGCLQQG